MGEQTNRVDRIEPVLEPPNGERVTTKDLKSALYDLDVGLSERFNIVLDAVGQLRQDFERHRQDGHPFTERADIVKEEIRLDAKKADVVARLLAVFAAAIGAGVAALRWLLS